MQFRPGPLSRADRAFCSACGADLDLTVRSAPRLLRPPFAWSIRTASRGFTEQPLGGNDEVSRGNNGCGVGGDGLRAAPSAGRAVGQICTCDLSGSDRRAFFHFDTQETIPHRGHFGSIDQLPSEVIWTKAGADRGTVPE